MHDVGLFTCVLFLIGKHTYAFQLSVSPIRPTAGFNLSFSCATNKVTVFEKDKLPYCVFNNKKDGKCNLDPKCPQGNTYSCMQTNTITIPGTLVNDNLHGTNWSCFSPFGDDNINKIELYVNIPITIVNIIATPTDTNPTKIVTGIVQQFKCTTDAGRPSARIQWYISNTNITDLATPQVDVCNSGCNGKVISSSVLIYTGNRTDEGKNIYCTALNYESDIVTSQNRTVEILYGASEVTFTPPRQFYTVLENSNIIGPISCKAMDCKPTCTLTWRGPNGPIGTTADLNLQNINRSQAGSYICWGTNIASNETSVSINVTVQYGPTDVSISPPTTMYIVNETGNVEPITCAADCNPVCTVKWNGPNFTNGNTSVFNLKSINRDQAGNYKCTAKNSVGNRSSIAVLVIVQYGPRQVNLSPSSNSYTVNETGTVGPINCTADCNPACSMTWTGPDLPDDTTYVLNLKHIERNQAGNYICTARNNIGSSISDTVSVYVNFGPRQVNISPSKVNYTFIEAIDSLNPIECTADCKPNCTMSWRGPNLSDSAASVLHLQNINRKQAGHYVCIASNFLGRDTSQTVNVIVQYGPGNVILSPNDDQYTVNETSSIMPISCTSDCNPNCTMTWDGPNLNVHTLPVLNLRNITRSQMGNYRCTASNIIGYNTSISVKITVNFRPFVAELFGNRTFHENAAVTLSCNVESVPTANIKWMFGDSNININDEVSVNKSYSVSTINIRRAGCLSMGNYTCTAWNMIGTDTKGISVDILCSPRLNTIEYNVSTLIAVKDQEPLNITVPIIAYPKPSIYWTFINNESLINVTDKTSNIIIKNRVFSHLYIENVTEKDFGLYRVNAYNDIGKPVEDIHAFEVIPERKPNPPQNISCIGKLNSVLVHWESMFNGGDKQTFQIFIRKDGDANYYTNGQLYSDPGQNRYLEANIKQLTQETSYYVIVRASNKHNYTMSEPAFCNTTSSVGDDKKSTNVVAIGAGTGIGAAITVLCIAAIIFIVIRRKKHDDKLGLDKELMKRSEAIEDDQDEDGLRDNPLYVSSTDTGAVYSTVDKYRNNTKDKDNTQVVKNHKQDIKNKQIEMGCVYKNSEDITHGHAGDVYANSEVNNQFEDKHVFTPKKNKDGLIYADLDLAPTRGGQRFVIRGLENRNNYAVIDLTKTAEPLPSDSDNDDDKTEKNTEQD